MLQVTSTERRQEQKKKKCSLTAAHTLSCFNHIHSNIINRKFTISLQLPKMFTLNIMCVRSMYTDIYIYVCGPQTTRQQLAKLLLHNLLLILEIKERWKQSVSCGLAHFTQQNNLTSEAIHLTGSDGFRNAIYTLWDKDIILVRHCSLPSVLKNPETFEQSRINIKAHVYHAQIMTHTILQQCIQSFMFLWPCIVSKAWRKNTNKMQQYKLFIVNSRCWLLTTVSTCFGHLYAHHQKKKNHVLLHMGFSW